MHLSRSQFLTHEGLQGLNAYSSHRNIATLLGPKTLKDILYKFLQEQKKRLLLNLST